MDELLYMWEGVYFGWAFGGAFGRAFRWDTARWGLAIFGDIGGESSIASIYFGFSLV